MVTLPHLRTSFRRGGSQWSSHPPSIVLEDASPHWYICLAFRRGVCYERLQCRFGPNQIYQLELRTSRSMLIEKRQYLVFQNKKMLLTRRFFPFLGSIVIAPFSHKWCRALARTRVCWRQRESSDWLNSCWRTHWEPFHWLLLHLETHRLTAVHKRADFCVSSSVGIWFLKTKAALLSRTEGLMIWAS